MVDREGKLPTSEGFVRCAIWHARIKGLTELRSKRITRHERYDSRKCGVKIKLVRDLELKAL